MAKKKAPVAKPETIGNPDAGFTFFAPSVRIFNEWTPERIRVAEQQAEQGNLRLAVQICEWLLTDDRVTATLDARIDALMGLDPTFEPAKGRKASQAVRALEADEDWFDSYPEHELRQLLRWGILLGAAVARHQWVQRPDHGNRILPMPTFWHPQDLTWGWTSRQWTVRDQNAIEHIVAPGDGEWVMHTPYGRARPWAHGLWRSLARWVLVKSYARADWARHSEKSSVTVVTAPEKATPAQRREVATDLAARGADAVVALANGFDLKVVEVTANTQQIYQAQIDMADKAITIRVRGGNLTTDVEGGSRAAAETQARTGDGAKLKSDALALSTTINQQSLSWWAEFNFGDRKLAPWPSWPVEPEEDKAARATMVKTLGEGLTIWDKLGFEIDPEAVQEEFGLSFLDGRPREREPDPVPTAAPKPAAKASVARMAADSGFVQGQLYTDDVVDNGRKKAGRALRPFLNELIGLVDEHRDDYDALRAAVIAKWHAQEPPERLREILQNCMILAQLAGHAAVQDDAND